MYFKKTSVRPTYWLLLAFVCLISPAYCQTTDVCGDIGATRTISSQADATVLSNCSIVAGSIALATAAAGSINLNGVQEILENLIVKNVGALNNLSSASLKQINGNFTINNVTTLSTLSFPLLTAVDNIEFTALPAIPTFTFTSGLSSVSNVLITNTFLATLDGINLQNADRVDINNNNRLKVISLPLETAKFGISIQSNFPKVVVNLPQLTSSGNITLRNISSIQLPSLNFLSGTLSLIGTSLGEFAVDALSVIASDLILLDNGNLTNTSFQGLLSAGTINIANNSALNSISFEKLSQAGNVSIAGNLTSVDMPVLTSVNHTLSLQSIDPGFNCSAFDTDHTKSIIKDNYTCLGTHFVSPSTNSTTPSSISGSGSTNSSVPGSNSKSDSNRTSGLSSGAKAGIIVACVVVAIAVAAGAIFLIRRRKKEEKDDPVTVGTDGKAEMSNQEVSRKELPANGGVHELAEDLGVAEMGTGEAHELPGEVGRRASSPRL